MISVQVDTVRGFIDATWKPLVLVAFGVWLITVGSHHEAWADEAQAWLIARDCDLVELLSERARYEGTPALWHLLLWTAVRCGLPFTQLYLVSVTCAVLGAAVLLWRAPFPAPLRVLLITSYFSAYQYSIVARSYALDLVLLPLAASLFSERSRRPIAYGVALGLIANGNAHGFVAAAVLGSEFSWTSWRRGALCSRDTLIGLSAATLLGLFALVVAWQPDDNTFLSGARSSPVASVVNLVREAFVDRIFFWSLDKPSIVDISFGFYFSILLLIPTVIALFFARKFLVFICLVAGQIAFSALGYANPWHAGILFSCWIFCLWISWPTLGQTPALARTVTATLAVITGVQTVEAANTGLWDISSAYSAGPAAAARLSDLRKNNPSATATAIGFKTVAIQPFFSQNPFVFPDGVSHPAYIDWRRSSATPLLTIPRVADIVMKSAPDALVVSAFRVKAGVLDAFEDEARNVGYLRRERLPGTLRWKGYAYEDDSLLVFLRAPSVP